MEVEREQKMHQDINYLMERKSYFAPEEFEPDADLLEQVGEAAKVLVIGAGGLGCEILKDLAMSGFKDITVIDMDKIDITNLNRQFLFRKKDVGRYKSEVAAEFVMKRVPACKIAHHTCAIQDFGEDFYKEFFVIIAGLDNMEARRWINSMVHQMVDFDSDGNPDESTQKVLIDGGTEGFKGQSRVIIPYKQGCFECTLFSLPPPVGYPMCTVRETPRLPEHCI
jgi:ubiquitin-activating enzyme E1 C